MRSEWTTHLGGRLGRMGTVLEKHASSEVRGGRKWREASRALKRTANHAKGEFLRGLSQEEAQEVSQASRQCIHEFKALFHRWEQESDLEQEDILECLKDALDEYYKEDVVDFDSEIDLDRGDEE